MKFSTAFVYASVAFASLIAAAPANSTETSTESTTAIKDAIDAEASTSSDSAVAVVSTENELYGDCKPVTVIFARGTNEPGNVGERAGPPVFDILRNKKHLGNKVAIQGVDYAATVDGYYQGGDPAGSAKMRDLINWAAGKCPKSKIFIGGYSQGAQLTHNAANMISDEVTSHIAGAFVFGDPFWKQPIGKVPKKKILSICHKEDIICRGHGGSEQHLNYDKNALHVANFIRKHS